MAARTGPMQSYANPAERCMSCLNLALQNVALCRESAGYAMEMRLKSQTSLAKLRNVAERDSQIKEAYIKSVQPVLEVLKGRFRQLRWQDQEVKVYDPAEGEDINRIADGLKLIDPSVDSSNIKDIKFHTKLNDFFERHCRCRHYTFQIKKCTESTCSYCVLNPSRLPEGLLEELHFVPDPVLGEDKQTYLTFKEVYGQDTTDSATPSQIRKPENTTKDKERKSLLVANKVRNIVTCSECSKARVVYSAKKLSSAEELALKRVQEELIYTCGSALFPSGPMENIMFVKEGINCETLIETTYYASKTAAFPEVCIHCSASEVLSGQVIQEKREEFGIVRPICGNCLGSGKQIVCRNALKVAKKQKKK